MTIESTVSIITRTQYVEYEKLNRLVSRTIDLFLHKIYNYAANQFTNQG